MSRLHVRPKPGETSGFRTGPVTVRPPATSANLGPGFDAFGLALELRDEVVVEALDEPGLAVEVDGEGAGEVPLDEEHLLVRSLRAGFDALGGQPAGLRVRCHNRIPHGRGLGSSSAAICAGLAAARALAGGGASVLDDDALLDLATRIEGHPDNVAPALRGGLTVAWTEDDGGREPGGHGHGQDADSAGTGPEPPRRADRQHEHMRAFAQRLTPDPSVSAVVFIPPNRLATAVARGLLPSEVPHRDAAANAGRAGLLIAALTTPDLTDRHRAVLLHAATRDRLHQDYRAPAMPDSAALIRLLRADGFAAAVSGAGPTVIVLTAGPAGPREAAAYAPQGWRVTVLTIAAAGVLTGPGGGVVTDTP
ncbi:MAG: homoserine kinase [Actinocrinis sp.]